MRSVFLTLAALLLAACATGAPRSDAFDAVAERFVKLTLEIGAHEEGYVDAYHGPPAWAAAASGRAPSFRARVKKALKLG